MPTTQPLLKDLLSVDAIRCCTDRGSFERGMNIDSSRYDVTSIDADRIDAKVVGTKLYYVCLLRTAEGIQTMCTCPVNHQWCKHAVAVGLHFCDTDGLDWDDMWNETALDPFQRFLTTASRDELVGLLHQLHLDHPVVSDAVEWHAEALHGDDDSVNKYLSALSADLSRSLHPRLPVMGYERVAETLERFELYARACWYFAEHGFPMVARIHLEDLLEELNRLVDIFTAHSGKILSIITLAFTYHNQLANHYRDAIDAEELSEWLTWVYFSTTYLPIRLDNYAHRLNTEQLRSLVCSCSAAKERFGEQHPKLPLYLLDVGVLAEDPSILEMYADLVNQHDSYLCALEKIEATDTIRDILLDIQSKRSPYVLSESLCRRLLAEYL